MTRQPLPCRRPNSTTEARFRGHPITVTIGYDLAGQPREVFASNGKSGSDMQATMADACVIISLALQHGISTAELAKSLGSVPEWVNGAEVRAPASPIGVIIAAVEDGRGE